MSVPDTPVRVSVVVLVDPRAEDLPEFHREIAERIHKLSAACEFVYVLNAPSEALLRQALALHEADPSRVRVLRFARPVAQSVLLGAACERARGEVLFTLEARFEAEVSAFDALHQAISGGADVALASRSQWRRGAAARFQSSVFSRIVSWLTGTRFRDLASPIRAVRREVLEEVPLHGDFHRYLPVLAERVGFVVREVPVAQHPRATARAIHSPRMYLWRAMDILSIFFLARFTRRPLRLFGGIGALFGVTGAGILVVVTLQRVLGTAMANRPILVLGALLVGISVQLFAIGLLGELLLFFHARKIRDYRVAEVYEGEPRR